LNTRCTPATRAAISTSGRSFPSGSGRRDHDDLGHLDHRGRHRVHDHGRRIDGLAAGHVDADALSGRTRVPNTPPPSSRTSHEDGMPLAVEVAHAHRALPSAARSAGLIFSPASSNSARSPRTRAGSRRRTSS
jgi:hypothetical protein